ncbi:hypothetical protein EEB11_14450 [Pseudotabrizicola sediminis]|uniref:Uncharacterized protein n=1 Tax=Pseudotabrizicola sediminis TaxID=2486418 RepID=A0ABY2KMB8_9RHOB|nr:hypothetical protein [Pseudotabrizicola sediminis]TGD42466.1 hypothetical protein EEB11_14450 [Pseudotabrizicola sediminis]
MANPLTPIDVFLPHDAAFMARTELSQMRRLGMNAMNLDTVTGHALGVIGRRLSVRHQACVTDEILALACVSLQRTAAQKLQTTNCLACSRSVNF